VQRLTARRLTAQLGATRAAQVTIDRGGQPLALDEALARAIVVDPTASGRRGGV
jgi:hypothetical protein